MGTLFRREQIEQLFRGTGVADGDHLASTIKHCGFDETAYLERNPDLRLSGLDAAWALFHFLAHGCKEERDILCGPLPDGLFALTAPATLDQSYSRRLFRSIFFGQLGNPATADTLWNCMDSGLVDWIRCLDGLPYVVIGDSHANHYRRRAWRGESWLAPLCIVCHGASAIGLANESSRSGFGVRILQWAENSARGHPEVPIFLKFGGIDAEFLWMSHRIRDGIDRFSVTEFEGFAYRSVTRYSEFLDRLSRIVGPARLRICTVFPSVLKDEYWADCFINANKSTPENDRRMAEAVSKLEIPDLRGRTQLRAVYNAGLSGMCAAMGLTFVDDFSPLMGADGIIDNRCFGVHGGADHHLDHAAAEETVVKILHAQVR